MKTFFLDQILIVTVVPHNLLSDECLVFFYGVDAASEPDRYAFSDVRGHFQPNQFRGPDRHYYVRPAFRSADRELHSALSTRGVHLLPVVSIPPSGCPFYVLPVPHPVVRGLLQTFSQSREPLTTQSPASSSSGSIPDGSDTAYAPTTYRR